MLSMLKTMDIDYWLVNLSTSEVAGLSSMFQVGEDGPSESD
jgi:hypothetical protein